VTDFSALSLGSSEELEALLLRSADDDEPADGSLEKVGLALGLGASALAVAAATSTVATTTAVAGQGATLGQYLGLASLAKWLGMGIAAGVVSAGAAHWAARPITPRAAPAAVVAPAPESGPVSRQSLAGTSVPAPPDVPVPPVEDSPAEPPSAQGAAQARAGVAWPSITSPASAASPASSAPQPETPPLPSAASFAPLDESAPAASAAAPATSASAPPPSTLGDETKALDRVRDHLTAGRTTQALSEIQRYRAQWPRGALAAEAAILRVDALLRSGNRAEADREAEALIKRAPESRYATRARALLGYKPE
jgi:hypothetical protein